MSILIPCSGFVIHFNCEQWLSSSLSCFRHLQTEIRTSPSPFQWYLGFCRLKQVNIAYLNWSLGNLGKVCVGGGGWSCVLGHSRFYILLEFFIAFAPLFRTKEESWVPGLLLVLQEACVMHVIHTHSQTIRAFEPCFCTEDLRHVQCLLQFKKQNKFLWPLTSLVEQPYGERRNLVMFPTTIFFPPFLFSLCCCFLFFPWLSTWIRWTCMSV